MSDLDTVSNLLSQSVIAATSKQAENQLKALETQPGFSLTLLHVISSTNLPISTRLAGAVFFKNLIKRRWVDEDGNHLISDSELIKKEIIPLMITLPNNLQVQIGEAISTIADSDFPMTWSTLIPDLVSKLTANDMVTNKGVLVVAHSIFKRWRHLFRSDDLFLEIKMVLEQFFVPFFQLLQNVDQQITENFQNQAKLELLFEVLSVLVKLYYDLNCQDIPESFEDNIKVGMTIMRKYLDYQNPLLEDEDDDEHPSIISKVKSSIQELVQLYTTRYEDVFNPLIGDFISSTWELLTKLQPKAKNDILVSKSMLFLSSVARIPHFFKTFNSEDAMSVLVDKIILPNITLHESDEELFEDDPIEYIRRDLEGSDSDTRRRSCTDFLKVLKERNQELVTSVILNRINDFFIKYQENPAANWKYKDLSVYLFVSIAVDGNITNIGVTLVNNLLNVVDFFTQHIMGDLKNDSSLNPILKVDAIKYIYTFRNQLNKAQLVELLPVLANFLQNSEYIVYTYAAITIERILSIRESASSTKFIFTKSDLSNSAQLLLVNLFQLIMKNSTTPEKLAENEFLMKTVFRILLIGEDIANNISMDLLGQLLQIISIIAKNPSNPRFTHYIFESVGVIIKYNDSRNLSQEIELMMPIMLEILKEDVQEFIPYSFQLIAYCLESLPSGSSIPNSIRQLSAPILSPAIWELKANVPAVTRLLKNFVKCDNTIYPDLVPVLGVFQRLISSKAFDIYGFELLEYIITYIPMESLHPFLKEITVLLFQRLQNSRTEKYTKRFVVFLGVISTKKSGDFVVEFIDRVQDGIFSQIWNNFVIQTIPTFGNLLDRKISLIGALNIVTNSQLFNSKYSNLIPSTLDVIITTVVSDSVINMKNDYVDLENLEEITTFGSSFSKLISISEKPYDPLPQIDLVDGVKVYIAQKLSSSSSLLVLFADQLSIDAKNGLIQLGLS
ncbi:probable Importin alpha re-exporter [Saccharomycodes ludwigii]|uniref:Probable Importin alpha re-exporter n=1 Tax=Saccharomycodes ludwigii TaxID=36035 RepID=A0A376B6A1_9ASCO|nr:probable Importin alpha re-exporter [Saccharomycodes ludwigii]